MHLSLFPAISSQTRLCCTFSRKEPAAASTGRPGSASVSHIRPHAEVELHGYWCPMWPQNLMAGAEISVPDEKRPLAHSTGMWRGFLRGGALEELLLLTEFTHTRQRTSAVPPLRKQGHNGQESIMLPVGCFPPTTLLSRGLKHQTGSNSLITSAAGGLAREYSPVPVPVASWPAHHEQWSTTTASQPPSYLTRLPCQAQTCSHSES